MSLLAALNYYGHAASREATVVDHMFDYIFIVSIFFFVLIVGLMGYFIVRYRRRSETDVTPHIAHNLPLEIAWSVIPLLLILVMFVGGYESFNKMMNARPELKDCTTIYVTGSKWKWKFEYENGGVVGSDASLIRTPQELIEEKTTKGNIHATRLGKKSGTSAKDYFTVPVGKTVRLVVTSDDVLHSLGIPAMRVKRDALGGQRREAIFTPTETGTYHYTCNEMCGFDHSYMVGYMKVVTQAEYDQFLTAIKPSEDPLTHGKALYELNCKGCHASTADSPPLFGPSWVGRFGKDFKLASGETITYDEAYVFESIRQPSLKRAEGISPTAVMSPYPNLSDKDIRDIITFMQTLK